MEDLEISKYLDHIVDLVTQNNVVSIAAPTGYGKTVGIPIGLGMLNLRVFISVPTKASVRSILPHVRKIVSDMGITNPDEFVSSAFDGIVDYNNNSKIIYATAGHIRRKIISEYNYDNLDFCDVLFVDEVHDQTVDITMILNLWKEAYKSGKKVPRLLMASATPIDLFEDIKVEYFRLDPIRKFEVMILYFPTKISYSKPEFLKAVIAAIEDIHVNVSLDAGDVLVFLAGKNEIEEAIKATPNYNNMVKLRLHGAMNDEESDAYFKEVYPKGIRRVIYATNAAESSITVKGLGFVIDTLLEKSLEMTDLGGTRLVTKQIAKDSAIQRAGRVGRTAPGIVLRCITEEEFDKLEQHKPRQLDILPIYEPILELISIKVDPYILDVDAKRVDDSIKLLDKLNIIALENGEGVVTDIGTFAVRVPLSVRVATFLYHWILQGLNYYQGCAIAALVDCYGPSYFYIIRKDTKLNDAENRRLINNHKRRYLTKYQSDKNNNLFNIVINMWIDMQETTGLDRKKIKAYCEANSLNNKKIEEMLNIYRQCMNVKPKNIEINTEIDNNFNLLEAKSILFKIFEDKLMIKEKGKTYRAINNETFTLDEKEKLTDETYDAVVALSVNETVNKDGFSNRIISFAFPVAVERKSPQVKKNDFKGNIKGKQQILDRLRRK